MEPQEAKAILALQKRWPTLGITWVKSAKKQQPARHTFRAVPLHKETAIEGIFVAATHMHSPIAGLPSKLSVSIIANHQRILGLDAGYPGGHTNKVGEGHPHYRKFVPHPHMHRPVDGRNIGGYAEPLPQQSLEQLWSLFMEEASIESPPAFKPPAEQIDWISQ